MSDALAADRTVPAGADPPSVLLRVQGLTCRFGGLAALEDVSFEVRAGTICGLIGPNGAGKTTLLNVVSGLIPPTSGQVQLAGVDLAGRPAHAVAALGVARTFQNIRLFSDLSVLENVMLGWHLRRRATVIESLLGLPRARRDERAARDAAGGLIERLGLAPLAATEAGALSYGDQRRVEIARALALGPKLLLLDEPVGWLNSTEKGRLGDFLAGLRADGLTLLVIEHDMELIMRLSDSVVVLNFGRKIADGPPEVIRQDRRVVEAYLGDDEEAGTEQPEGPPLSQGGAGCGSEVSPPRLGDANPQ